MQTLRCEVRSVRSEMLHALRCEVRSVRSEMLHALRSEMRSVRSEMHHHQRLRSCDGCCDFSVPTGSGSCSNRGTDSRSENPS